MGTDYSKKIKEKSYHFYRQHFLTAIHAQVYFPTNNSSLVLWDPTMRNHWEPMLCLLWTTRFFSWKKDQSSYYFLLNSAESISLLRRFVLALQLDINIHTIIRWNDDDDCYCYYQYYYCCCSLFVFWGALDLLIHFNRSDILWILHGFVHVFKVGFAHPAIHFLCDTSTKHLLACFRRSVRIVEWARRKRARKKIRWKEVGFFLCSDFFAPSPPSERLEQATELSYSCPPETRDMALIGGC